MQEPNSSKPNVMSEIEATTLGLSIEEIRTYCQALYSVAHDAMQARCGDLKVKDLEIITSLEEKSNAYFEEWLHSCMIRADLS